jgi:alkylated DNA repair dioxygenase AlkB
LQPSATTPDQAENGPQTELQIEGTTSIKIGNGELLYAESWLPDSDQWFERLKTQVPWSPEQVLMFGKPMVLARQTCNFGADYDYNPNAKPAVGWAGPVLELKKMLEKASGRIFTQCACNLYPSGETGIGLHHDKRHPLLIASISFGAVRTIGFAIKGGKLDKSLPMIPLASGSLLLFTDTVNEHFKHTILEEKSVSGPRISVTFREFPAIEKNGDKVTRQMSPNSAPHTGTPPLFQSVADFVVAYKIADKNISHRTAAFVGKASDAKTEQDKILPHLAYMQALLSKKGTNHELVIKARKQGNKIPWWTEYYKTYQDKLWESLRTMERRIAEYRSDPSLPKRKAKRKGGPVAHLNKAARKALIDGNHKAVELVKALEAGRDGKSEVTAFKQVMNAKRLDDILTTATEEVTQSQTSSSADELKVALANEPDRDIASKLLTQYLDGIAQQFANARIKVSDVRATITLAGRNHRIMPGDWLAKKDNQLTKLAKCTGVGEYMSRRRIQEWTDGKWQKEHVVFTGDEADYQVITEEAARGLVPEAFP